MTQETSLSDFFHPVRECVTWCVWECVDWFLNWQCLKRTLNQFIEWFNSSWVRHTNCMIISQNFGIWVASITWCTAVTIPKWCLPPRSWFISRCKQKKYDLYQLGTIPGVLIHIYTVSVSKVKKLWFVSHHKEGASLYPYKISVECVKPDGHGRPFWGQYSEA